MWYHACVISYIFTCTNHSRKNIYNVFRGWCVDKQWWTLAPTKVIYYGVTWKHFGNMKEKDKEREHERDFGEKKDEGVCCFECLPQLWSWGSNACSAFVGKDSEPTLLSHPIRFFWREPPRRVFSTLKAFTFTLLMSSSLHWRESGDALGYHAYFDIIIGALESVNSCFRFWSNSLLLCMFVEL